MSLTSTDAMNRVQSQFSQFVQTVKQSKGEGFGAQLSKGQSPYVAVVTCADSRVSPEVLLQEDLGEVFVIRSAGNYPAPHAVASLEYAVAHLGVQLIVLMGHSHCGAVTATIDHVKSGEPLPTPSLQAMVDDLKPAAVATEGKEDWLGCAIAENVQLGTKVLMESPILSKAVSDGKLKIEGAVFHLDKIDIEWVK